MIQMKVRYGFSDVQMKISNVNPREREQEGYVLLTASDEKNEIAFELTHEQAENLSNELYEANRRWKEHSSKQSEQNVENDDSEQAFAKDNDHFAH